MFFYFSPSYSSGFFFHMEFMRYGVYQMCAPLKEWNKNDGEV